MPAVTPTEVVFTERQYTAESVVQMVVAQPEGGSWLVTALTPFHPVSHIWPDHPADWGSVSVRGTQQRVTGCFYGAVELASHQLFVGSDIPVKRNEEGWVFVVVHQTEQALPADLVGETVQLEVERDYQLSLSRGHSAGHLSSLALNKVLHHDYWRKDASRKDELGHYDFHSYAQTESRVSEDCSTDTYRLGKTLRKRGLNSADMLEALPQIAEHINQQLEQWRAMGAKVVMRREGSALTDSRYWQCDLGEEGLVEIPCGGTHVQSLVEYQEITVSFQVVSDQELIMLTRTVAA
ncbi:metal-dependent hydrolase [Photobacterium sanctipauli]|uniref:Metal-dependent hydrolase n=1 Tax=Photobacterium sanctipauli TaxID=1342794 RepID=A0A2T3NTS5_9GAMM|nr:metal-dependent hydrolase [Photobacterium sanctipauli]PSW19662.1 metal-dependent hydrolase [Photobacterium sanctipauli]